MIHLCASPLSEGVRQLLPVATIADLTELTAPTETVSIQALGYWAKGDGGGGPIRYYDTTSTATPNGGSVLQPDSLPAAGRWLWSWTGWIDVRWFGVNPSQTGAVNSARMQALIDAALGARNYAGPGTYLLDAVQVINQQTDVNHPPTRLAAAKMTSDMHFIGVPGRTIFKMKDGISSDAAPLYYNMFMSNTYDVNVSFEGITFDMNGQNNLHSPGRPGAYITYHQSALFWGSDASNVARPDNLVVRNCVFKNTAGTNQIVTAFSITVPAPIGVGCTIEDNQFIDNGFDVNDHSTCYLRSKNITFTGNKFSLPTCTIISQNTVEFHGPNVVCSGNVVDDYYGGAILVGSTSGVDVTKQELFDNIFRCKFNTIICVRDVAGAGTLLNTIDIHDNLLEIVNSADPFAQDPSCIQLFPNAILTDVFVHHNVMRKTGGTTYGCYGVVIGNASPGLSNNNIHIESNSIDSFSKGISWPQLAGTGSCGKLFIDDNTITNCTTSTTPAILATGIEVAVIAGQVVSYLHLSGNRIYDTTGTTSRGVVLAGTITNLYQDDNLVLNSGTANWADTATVTNRYGTLREVAFTYDPASLGDGIGENSAAISVPGAAFGDQVQVSAPYDLQALTATGYVESAGVVRIRLQNESGGTVDLGSGAWRVRVTKQEQP